MRSALLTLVLSGCAADPSLCEGSASPQTIDAMVTHLNDLPRPIDAACIIRSLARPLQVEATTNPFSAQPADGPGNPRIFLSTGNLSISLTPVGIGSRVVEFGETVDALHSLKGELALPIDDVLDPSDPHDKILEGEGTVCRICHIEESSAPNGFGHTSIAIKPMPDTLIDLQVLEGFARSCRAEQEPARCSLLEAVFDGEAQHAPFPENYPTIFDLVPQEYYQ